MPKDKAEQPELFPGEGSSARSFEPVEKLESLAKGMGYTDTGIASMRLSPQREYMLGKAYQKRLGSTRVSPRLQRSYEALRGHIGKQFDTIQKSGLDITFGESFYPNAPALAQDLRKGKLAVSATTPDQSSAVFSDEENDKFRAIHDVLGHGATGRGFSPSDEYAAYEAHARTLPKQARRALFSEVVGQAAYWGVTGEFAPQTSNVVDMPNWAVEGRDPRTKKRTYIPRYKQGKLF